MLEEVAALFNIHEKALAHGTAFVNIRDAAYKRLQAIDAEMASKLAEEPAPAPVVEPESESTVTEAVERRI